MKWKETLKIIFDESKEKTNAEHIITLKAIAFTLYPLGIIGSFFMIWSFVREEMTVYYWLSWVIFAVVASGIGLYGMYRKLKQSGDK